MLMTIAFQINCLTLQKNAVKERLLFGILESVVNQ